MSTVGTRTESTSEVAAALARLRAACRRPGFGHAVITSETRLGERLACTTRDGHATIESDLSAALGGEASAPSPSALVRAALGACLAMGYRLRAAERGIELIDVTVVVESESELVGMLDADASAPPGFTGLRYRVDITSPAAPAELERLVELADRLSPVLDLISRPQAIERAVSIHETES